MGFLDRAIRRGISQGISDAIGNAVQKTVEPKATELANKAAESIDKAAGQTVEETKRSTSGFEGAMANLQRSMEGYATEASKNIKVCPSCGEPATADKKFCPSCGAALPEMTVAQGSVCPSCGKQNTVGTKFCSDCGTKLPSAIAEEEAAAASSASVLAEWDNTLLNYPKWNCGGTAVEIQYCGSDEYVFIVEFDNHSTAVKAVEAYRELLQANGYKPAGQYPSIDNLYAKIDGVCYHVNTGMCFEGDPNCATIGFDKTEPLGGFDYVKPEPKKTPSFKDLLKF